MPKLVVTNVTTKASHPIVVFGDTSGFTRFAQRTYENPKIVRDYLLKTINLYFDYERRTSGHLKLECDGFISFHDSTEKTKLPVTKMVLRETEILYAKIMDVIRGLRYPRPDGYRISVADGPAWNVQINVNKPKSGEITINDSYGYPGYLASRMQETHKSVSLKCSQGIYEMFEGRDEGIVFEQLKKDRRVPEGIFKEDWLTMWSYRST